MRRTSPLLSPLLHRLSCVFCLPPPPQCPLNPRTCSPSGKTRNRRGFRRRPPGLCPPPLLRPSPSPPALRPARETDSRRKRPRRSGCSSRGSRIQGTAGGSSRKRNLLRWCFARFGESSALTRVRVSSGTCFFCLYGFTVVVQKKEHFLCFTSEKRALSPRYQPFVMSRKRTRAIQLTLKNLVQIIIISPVRCWILQPPET